MVQLSSSKQRDNAAQRVGLELYVRIGEHEQLAARNLISTLKSVRFAEPALRKFANVHDLQLRMVLRECIENTRGVIGRAVVYGNDLQVGIIDGHQSVQRSGQLFLLIASSEDQRDSWAIFVFRCGVVFQPRQPGGAVSDLQSIRGPEKRNESENKCPEEVHADWSREPASGYPSIL